MSTGITIGIDPAFRKNGFGVCVIDETGEAQGYQFRGLLEFIRWVDSQCFHDRVIVGIENSNMINATFDMKGTKGAIARKSRNVGANQAASQYTVDFCRWFFGPGKVFEISPKDKGGKYDQKTFQQVVKQEGHTIFGKWNQDKRDAYKLALIAKKKFGFVRAKIIQ